MGSGPWSREELTELVRGTVVLLRGPDAGDRPVPAWLGDAADGVLALDSSESIELTHPDDRALLVDSFVRALGRPEEPSTCRVRIRPEGTWQHSEIRWLNLIDHPDVGGILCSMVDVAGPAIEPVALSVDGDSTSANWMILVLGDLGVIVSARGRVEEILGHRPEEVVGRNAVDFLHPDSVAGATANWIELMQHPERTRTSRRRWLGRDGGDRWLESSYLVHEDSTVELVVVDIDDRVANEQALADSQAEVAALAADFRLLADEVPAAVFRCDAAGLVQFHNARWTEAFPDEAVARHVQDIVHPDDRGDVERLLAEVVADDASEPRILEVRAADGRRVLSFRCRSVSDDASDPRIVGSVSDISATVHLRHQASHDPLTGLRNRSSIEADLAEALADDADGTLVVFIDLDGFKAVNDLHGHDAGDAVLIEVARRLERGVRPDDAVGRYGGDEFVVVCRGVPDADTDTIIERLERALEGPIELDGSSWRPDASIGAARPAAGTGVAAILRSADRAMYESKQRRGASAAGAAAQPDPAP